MICRVHYSRISDPISVFAAGLFLNVMLFSQEDIVIDSDYLQALSLKGEGKYSEAAAEFKQVIKKYPKFGRAYAHLASVYQEMGKQAEAREFFNSLSGPEKRNSFTWFGLGLVSQEEYDDSLAVRYFRKAIDLNPDCGLFYTKLIDVSQKLNVLEPLRISLRKQIRLNPNRASLYYALAWLHWKNKDWQDMLDLSRKAMALKPAYLEAQYLEAWALGNLGRYDEEVKLCERSILLARQRNDIEVLIDFLEEKSYCLGKRGDHMAAIDCLNQAVSIAREIRNRKRTIDLFDLISQKYWYLDDYQQALHYAGESLMISRELNDLEGQASSLNYMGIFYTSIGEIYRGLSCYYEALDLFRQIDNKGGEGTCLGNIAWEYIHLGAAEKAVPLLKRAVAIFHAVKGWERWEATYISNLGSAYRKLQRFEEALEQYRRAYDIISKHQGEEHQASNFLGSIGEIYQEMGEYEKAIEYCRQALEMDMALFKKSHRSANLLRLGNVYLEMGEADNASHYYQEAYNISRSIKNDEYLWKIEAGLGYIFQLKQDTDGAIQFYKQAVNDIEGIRNRIVLDEEKIGFFEDKSDIYKKLIMQLVLLNETCPKQGYEVEGFEYTEKARARAFLDILAESRARVRKGIDPALLQRERDIFRQISRIQTEMQKPDLNAAKWDSLSRALIRVEDLHDEFKRELRNSNVRYANLVYPEPCTLSQVQARVLNSHTALLEFCLNEPYSILWCVTKDDLHLISLPPGNEIEAMIRDYMQTISMPVGLNNPFLKHVSPGFRLYNCLISPAISHLSGISHLIIVCDGLLHYLPMEALVTQKTENPESIHYFNEDYQISYAPSASVIGTLHEEQDKHIKTANKLLAFGDPDFGESRGNALNRGKTNSVTGDSTENIADMDFASRGLYEKAGIQFRRLPHSGDEVEEISHLFKDKEKAVYLRENAKEEIVKQLPLTPFRYIHFATHGIIDQDFSNRSGIVLTLDDDPAEDGFLQMNEILNLEMNADLVVLSACQTGLGTFKRGEGIVGLTRAFMYAGARSILVSLWNINDGSTAVFMKNFYQHLQENRNKTESLQLAKSDMLRSERSAYHHPFYWAPFVLIGEGR